MTIDRAMRIATKLCQGFPFTMRSGELIEYNRLCYNALHAQQQREQLWHDTKADPPPQNGLYYGEKDDTNSMWAVQYKDGIWTLDAYPEQQMDIVRWAFYDAFCGDDEQDAEKNDPLTLDELREMDGQPVWVISDEKEIKLTMGYGIIDCECGRVEGLKYRVLFEDYGDWLAYRRPPEKEA